MSGRGLGAVVSEVHGTPCHLRGSFLVYSLDATASEYGSGRPNRAIKTLFNLDWNGNVVVARLRGGPAGIRDIGNLRSEDVDMCNVIVGRYVMVLCNLRAL